MADIDGDPTTMSTHGHTMPVSRYKGSTPLKAGLTVTVGPANQEWKVLRIDAPDGDDPESVFHIHRP